MELLVDLNAMHLISNALESTLALTQEHTLNIVEYVEMNAILVKSAKTEHVFQLQTVMNRVIAEQVNIVHPIKGVHLGAMLKMFQEIVEAIRVAMPTINVNVQTTTMIVILHLQH